MITDHQKSASNPYGASGDHVIMSDHPNSKNFSEGKNAHLTAENFAAHEAQNHEPQRLSSDHRSPDNAAGCDEAGRDRVNELLSRIRSMPDRASRSDHVKPPKPTTVEELNAQIKNRRYRLNAPRHKRHGAIVRIQGQPGKRRELKSAASSGHSWSISRTWSNAGDWLILFAVYKYSNR